MNRAGLLALTALLLAGCRGELDTTYGAEQGGSVNGCQVLLRHLGERTRLRPVARLSPRLERDCTVIIHLARHADLPDDEAMDWLRDWLRAVPGRGALLILRDGNPAPWLCRRWRDELPAGSAEERERLERAAQAAEEPAPGPPGRHPSLATLAGPRLHPVRLQPGLAVPATLTVGRALAEDGEDPGAALLTAELPDGRRATWARAWTVGDSRLVVAANATPLLDGALADPAARALAARLLAAVLPADGGRPAAAWVEELSLRAGEPAPANPMALLFATPPIAWATWHLVAVALLLVGAAAVWIGRREDPPVERRARFGRHLDALARLLQDGGHAAWCARAIARLRGLPTPPRDLDPAGARAWLARHTTADPPSGPRP